MERKRPVAALKFAKIERTSVASQVYDDIRESVLSGSLLPGTHLAEPQIASQMGVSRSPVREAFQRLEANGLITIHPSQGAFVRGLSTDEVRDIYTARILIEGYMAELASQKASRADAKALRQAVAEVDEVARKEDYRATIDADFALHRLVWEIAGHHVCCPPAGEPAKHPIAHRHIHGTDHDEPLRLAVQAHELIKLPEQLLWFRS